MPKGSGAQAPAGAGGAVGASNEESIGLKSSLNSEPKGSNIGKKELGVHSTTSHFGKSIYLNFQLFSAQLFFSFFSLSTTQTSTSVAERNMCGKLASKGFNEG